MNQVNLEDMTDEEIQALGFAEYNRREAAREAIANAERNIILINAELEKRIAKKEEPKPLPKKVAAA